MKRRRIAFCLFLLWLGLFCVAARPIRPLTVLEKSSYTRLTHSAEISEFLGQLAHMYAVAQIVGIGESVRGRPVHALLLSEEPQQFRHCSSRDWKLTVMLVGSQHGTEPSGAEAILLVARDVVAGRLRPYLKSMNLILVPNSNPDGRESRRRCNGNSVNLSTDFMVLSQPESRALNDTLVRWRPEVVLDVHESAVLKRKSLAKQGYLTDFEAQFEAVNNPNVDREIRVFSLEKLLPEVITLVKEWGLPAQRYIGEITDINQPITHGGLSLRNLRNKAGIMGSFSFLLENRLDPSDGRYASPGNIRERVAKQYVSICAFLECCRKYRDEILDVSTHARRKWQDPGGEEPLYLVSTYVADQSRPSISVTLRKLDTREPVERVFAYHGAVSNHCSLTMPTAYVVTAHQRVLKELLNRHQIRYRVGASPGAASVTIQRILSREVVMTKHGSGYSEYSVGEREAVYTTAENDLWISLDQPVRRLIPLLFEPRSISSVFNDQRYSHLIQVGEDFLIYRVYEADGRLEDSMVR